MLAHLGRVIPLVVAEQIVNEQGARSVNIPIEAHILAVADAYQKLTSPDPTGRRLSPQQAGQEIIAGAGKQFHTGVIEAFNAASTRRRREPAPVPPARRHIFATPS